MIVWRRKSIFIPAVIAMWITSMGLVGCAGRAVETQRPSRLVRAAAVQSSEETGATSPAPQTIRNRFQDLLNEALYDENHFQRGNQLTIKWQIVEYREGNRALRYVVGFGAGQGKVVVKARFLDEKGHEIASIQSEGTITMGAFGGAYQTALSKCADAIAKYTKETFSPSRTKRS
jgi:uncharacterized protein DUF4410